MIQNVISVDLESFLHREQVLEKRNKKDDGFTIKATNLLLDLFDTYKIKTTFFVVGEMYEWYPALIDKIAKKGHEIGYHGHRHIPITSKKILREEMGMSGAFLKKYKPIGFRAPRIYLPNDCLEILHSYGFRYDSSLYGGQSVFLQKAQIVEVPISMGYYRSFSSDYKFPKNLRLSLLHKGIPFGSGLFLSLFQKKTQYFIERENKKDNPAILFIHPWQLLNYPQNLSLQLGPNISRILYRKKICNTLEFLLGNNHFVPMRTLLKTQNLL